ncbi:MAG: GDSL-type esterase/lipase family protein, partial [Solirubrobacterales bacterium]
DWGQLSSTQAAEDDPDAAVIFIGANEGYPMPGPGGRQVNCCGSDWEAIFRSRVEQMIDNYLEGGAQRIYWLTIPTQRDPARKPIADAVSRAIAEAAASRGAAVRVVDLVPIFTPGDSYRDSMEIDGKQTIVRESDGIHLNDTGSSLAADVVLQAVDSEFDY